MTHNRSKPKHSGNFPRTVLRREVRTQLDKTTLDSWRLLLQWTVRSRRIIIKGALACATK